MNDDQPAVASATRDDINLLETVFEALEHAATNMAEPIDLRRLAGEVNDLLVRWHREERQHSLWRQAQQVGS